jgi:RHS repeat-associated protein
MRMSQKIVLLSILLFGFAAVACAQDDGPNPNFDSGINPYQSLRGGDIDTIDMSNGNLIVQIPMLSYPQRGILKLDLGLTYNNRVFQMAKNCTTNRNGTTTCVRFWTAVGVNWVLSRQGFLGAGCRSVVPTNTQLTGTYILCGGSNSDGSIEHFGQTGATTWRSLGGKGTTVSWNGTATGNFIATDRQGIQTTTFPSAPAGTPSKVVQDSNGNQISIFAGVVVGSADLPLTDSLGRSIPLPVGTSVPSGCPSGTATATSWAPPTYGGGSATYSVTFCYANLPIVTPAAFNAEAQAYSGSKSVLQAVLLPNGTAYTFQYDAYGDLSEITLPTGGTISYTWASLATCPLIGESIVNTQVEQVVATRTVNANDGTGPHTWTYNFGTPVETPTPITRTDSVTDPLGNATVYTETGLGNTCSYYETKRVNYTGPAASNVVLKTVATTYTYSPNEEGLVSQLAPFSVFNVLPASVITTWPNGQESEVTYQYDTGFTYTESNIPTNFTAQYGNVLTKSEYDYGSGVVGSLLRTTSTSYYALNNSTYLANNLLNLPASVQIKNGGGTQVAYTTYGYDGPGSPQCVCGNQTSVSRWLNTTGGYLVTNNIYDSTGRLTSTTDPNGNSTTFAYSAGYAGSGPTSVTNALNQTISKSYDFSTGLLASTTDLNAQLTRYTHDPETWRTTQMTYPDGGQISYCYSDTPSEGCASGPPYQVTITKKITASLNEVGVYIFDGMGRLSETELTSDPSGPDYTVITYDADGNKGSQTNPYRKTSDTTYGITSYLYDGLNRPKLVTKPDGSTITTVYTGNCTTVTDEATHARKGCVDGAGRLTAVLEDPTTGGLNYPTYYSYDALDDLQGVLQGGAHNRSFVYDSLKRLRYSGNPETGGSSNYVVYTYDGDNNVLTKKDNREVTITYTYDALNRMTERTYSTGDHLVGYSYDSATCVGVSTTCYNVGHMTGMLDAAGTELFSYDPMGRLSGDERTFYPVQHNIPGVSKTTSYAYNLDGTISNLYYPTGNVFTYGMNGAGLPNSLGDGTNTYVSPPNGLPGTTYTPWGALSSLVVGDSDFQLLYSYDARLQASQTVGWAMYSYNEYEQYYNMIYLYNYGSGDNGNLVKTINAMNPNRSQVYTYDNLNRITSAGTWPDYCTANCWGLTFGLDEWANMTTATATGTALPVSLAVNTNNQITTAPFTYDAAGNELTDTTATYTWNAEGQLATAGGVTYLYDGKGNRVLKSGETYYWYGRNGEVLNETDTTGSVSNTAFSEYVYFAGKRIGWRDYLNNMYFYVQDQIGSARQIVFVPNGGEKSGPPLLCYDADFYPYGGEIVFTPFSSCTTEADTYKFQGKERDKETGNDYFGARFYSSTYGRFLSADWSSIPVAVPYANLNNPQTLNLYAFVNDNPESFADLDGHDPGVCNSGGSGGDRNCPNPPQNPASDQNKQPQTTTTTVTLNSRAADIPGGQLLHDVGVDHEWISTPDGTDVGMGTAKGVPQSDAPGVQTQVVDHTGQVPTSTQTFTGVDKAALSTYTQVGTPTGRWVPGVNDCNTWARSVISESTPHTVLGVAGISPAVYHNVVVYADGSIHSPGAQ